MILEFIKEYIIYLEPGYNLLNTIIFGLILGLVIILIIKMFNYIKKDPKDLLIPLIPFIFFGSSTRALVDNGIYPLTYLLVTPGIYVLTGLMAISTLLISVFIEKKTDINYRHIILGIGLIICIPNILKISAIDLNASLLVLVSWSIFTSFFIILRKKWSVLNSKINLYVISAHLFDASSTFVAVDLYGYSEQHVLPSALTNLTGTALVMYPLKIIVILAALYVIDIYVEDDSIKNMLKLAIFILGLAPGLRNFLSLIMAV
ncbi:MAG: DUF63 family protein [Methanobacteriaceae archaeon]|nr:DUF63 family protein [Methanobacteriaceae archaeon]